MSKKVANYHGGKNAVYREDGTRLYGMDAELELKTRKSRDKKFEKEILLWICKVTKTNPKEKEGIYLDSLWKSLKNGVLLCLVVNEIQPQIVKKVDRRDIAIVHSANINMYLKACWTLGVPSSDMFAPSDLYNAKDMRSVVQNLFSLTRLISTKKKWKGPQFTYSQPALGGSKGKLAHSSSTTPTKKWTPVETSSQLSSVEQLEEEEDEEDELDGFPCPDCHSIVPYGAKFCRCCGSALPSSFYERNQAPAEVAKYQQQIRDLLAKLERQETKNKDLEREVIKVRQESGRLKKDRDRLSTEIRKQQDSHKDSFEDDNVVLSVQKELMEWADRYNEVMKREQMRKRMTRRTVMMGTDTTSIETYRLLQQAESERDEVWGAVQDVISKILGSDANWEDTKGAIPRLKEMLRGEGGRRQFVAQLRQQRKSSQSVDLPSRNFSILKELLIEALSRDELTESHDYKTALHIWEIASNISTTLNSTKTFLNTDSSFLGRNVWREIGFWEEKFTEELCKKHKRYFSEASTGDSELNDFMSTLLCSYLLNMLVTWEFQTSFAMEFVDLMITNNKESIHDPKALKAEITCFLKKTIGEEGETEPTVESKQSLHASELSKDRSASGGSFLSTLRMGRQLSIPPGPILKQGQLSKKGGHRHNWLPRWFVLKPDYLIYLKSAKYTKAQGIIHLKDSVVQAYDMDHRPNCFIISSRADSRDYFLVASTEQEKSAWVAAVSTCISDVHKLKSKQRKRKGGDPSTEASPSGAGTPQPEEKKPPASETLLVIADYTPADPRVELTLRKGDRVTVLKRDNSGWWAGQIGLKKGWFSKEYVQQ